MLIKDFVTKQIVLDAIISTGRLYSEIEITNDFIRIYYSRSTSYALHVDIFFDTYSLYIIDDIFKSVENDIIKYIHQQYRLFNIKEILK